MEVSPLSNSDSIRIVSNFLLHSPPGEFNEVFNDIRMLLNNDALLRDACAPVFAQYNKEQFIPVKIEGVEKRTLITPFNELHDGRFYDPRSKKSFKYEHLRKEALDIQVEGTNDTGGEVWRKAMQEEADRYVDKHYRETGAAAVFANNDALTVCIESHRYQSKNFWNGRWRSQWIVPFVDGSSGPREIKGTVKIHVHYYENGNVQFISSKELTAKVILTADLAQTANNIFKIIWDEESSYQDETQTNFQHMSLAVFRSLRRQLPVTGLKFDWCNTRGHRVGKDMKP